VYSTPGPPEKPRGPRPTTRRGFVAEKFDAGGWGRKKRSRAVAFLLTACTLIACGQNCPAHGSPNTTYVYSYTDAEGVTRFGSFRTNENGNAEISNVPSDVDCSKVTYREDAALPEAPPQN